MESSYLFQKLAPSLSSRRMSSSIATEHGRNPDPFKMSKEELDRMGIRRHPGSHSGPLQQRGGLTPLRANWWVRRELWPIYPLFGMVTLGVGLALWISSRHLTVAPEVYVSKNRRQGIPELNDPDDTHARAHFYANSSPLRHFSQNLASREPWRSWLFHEPPHLPGDDTAVVGDSGAKGKGPPLGGGY
jgi:hypothetical protein